MLTKLLCVEGVQYYVHDTATHLTASLGAAATFFSDRQDLTPCTVINWAEDRFESKDLGFISNDFALHDDVWSPSFLDGKILLTFSRTTEVTDFALIVLILRTPKSTVLRIGKWEIESTLSDETFRIPNGPYAIQLKNGNIFAVSRFFDDIYHSFIGGSVKSIGDSFEWLNIEVSLIPHSTRFWLILEQRNNIAVPSKLYTQANPIRSLSGVSSYTRETIS